MSDISIPNFRFKKYTSNLVKTRLSKIATFNPKSSLPENFKYIDLESVLGTELVSYREETRESAPSRAQRVAQKGDVFYQMVRPYQKNNYLFDLNENNYVFSTGYAQLRPKVDSAFLLARLQEEGFVNKVIERCTGTSYPAINSKDLSRISITIPEDLDEQSAIGSLFRTLDDLLASYKDNLANYQSLKATMLSKMFPKAGQTVPEIRLDGFKGEWEIVKLGDNCRIITGGTPRTGVKEFWNPKEIPWMSSGEINKKILNETEEMISHIGLDNSSAKWVKQNSVLIALAGQGQTRGRVAINKIPLTTNQSIAAIETNDNIDFLFLYTDLSKRYDELRLISSGDGTRGGLNKTIISNLELSIPGLEEQQAIGSYFSNLDNLINSYQEKISQLETLKKKLLQDMFI